MPSVTQSSVLSDTAPALTPPPSPAALRIRDITEADHPAVAGLLAKGFHRPAWYYTEAQKRLSSHPPPGGGLPKYGVLMEADGIVVGAILLIFSSLRSGANAYIRCNTTSWYVETPYRSYASTLSSRALRHKNVTYLNISARPGARPLLAAQGYQCYSQGQYFSFPALLMRSPDARVKICGISTSPDVPFDADDLQLLRNHAAYGCMSVWCVTPERAYPFVFLPRRFKRVLPGVQLIYCRDIEDIVRFAAPLGRFLVARGMVVVSVDANGPIAGLPGRYFEGKSPRFFKGPQPPRLGDLAYTQSAMFPWPWYIGHRPPDGP
jgi:hypothetical protein